MIIISITQQHEVQRDCRYPDTPPRMLFLPLILELQGIRLVPGPQVGPTVNKQQLLIIEHRLLVYSASKVTLIALTGPHTLFLFLQMKRSEVHTL